MQSEESNTLVKLAKAVIEHAPEGCDAFWDIKFSDIEAALSAQVQDVAGWQWRHKGWTGGQWQNCPDGAKDCKIPGAEYRPVYVLPTAPVDFRSLEDHVLADFTHLTENQSLSGPYLVKRIKERFASFALSAQVQDDSEIVDCLLAGKPFIFDPATNFCHADDGGAPEHGIKYVPAAQVQDVAERKPIDLNVTKEWFEKRAALEGDHEIGAGSRKKTICVDPTSDELAELFRIAHRIPEGWQLVPVEPTAGMIAAAKSTTSAALTRSHATEIYRAMLAAAPAKQEGGHD